MKANRQRSFNWTTWGIILIFSPIVCYLLSIYLKDFIRITPVAGFLAPLLLYQSSVVCLVIGALRSNPIRRYGCLRAAGFVLIDIAVSFVWFALWNPQATWVFPIPLSVIAVVLLAAILLCFVFSTPPGRK